MPSTIAITPAQMDEFWNLFRDWQQTWPTCDQLAAGGAGDLDQLAQTILPWAEAVLHGTELLLDQNSPGAYIPSVATASRAAPPETRD